MRFFSHAANKLSRAQPNYFFLTDNEQKDAISSSASGLIPTLYGNQVAWAP